MQKIKLDLYGVTLKVSPEFLREHLTQEDGMAFIQYESEDPVPLYEPYQDLLEKIRVAERSE